MCKSTANEEHVPNGQRASRKAGYIQQLDSDKGESPGSHIFFGAIQLTYPWGLTRKKAMGSFHLSKPLWYEDLIGNGKVEGEQAKVKQNRESK